MNTDYYKEIADCGAAKERVKLKQDMMLDLYNKYKGHEEQIDQIAKLLAESQQLMDEYDQLAEDYENLMNEVNR
jgi:hypothetical protein